MNVLVTGANGFVGRQLCEALTQQNFNVTSVVRNDGADTKHTKLIKLTLSNETDWDDALRGVDVIIHLAGRAHVMQESVENSYQAYADINIYATKHLAEQAALSGVKRFIFLSSIKVNGESTGKVPFNELLPPKPEDDYGRTKYEAEKCLNTIAKKTKMEVVIIRPPLVYGEGVKANFKKLIKLSRSGLPMPFGAVDNKRSLIYIENLIDFILLCIKHPKAANETFLVSDNDDVSTTDMIRLIAYAGKKRPMLLPVPTVWITFISKLIGKQMLAERLCGNLQVDISKAKSLLNWKPPYNFKEGIVMTVQPR